MKLAKEMVKSIHALRQVDRPPPGRRSEAVSPVMMVELAMDVGGKKEERQDVPLHLHLHLHLDHHHLLDVLILLACLMMDVACHRQAR